MNNTLYETIKTYGKGKGEEMMWRSVAVISDSVDKNMSEDAKSELLSSIYGLMSEGHYNEPYAMRCVAKLYYADKSGTKHYAPYWTEEQVRPIYEELKDQIPEYNFWDFFVTFNMLASDNWNLLHEWWPNITAELFAQKIAELSLHWLGDTDWGSNSKIWDYMHAHRG